MIATQDNPETQSQPEMMAPTRRRAFVRIAPQFIISPLIGRFTVVSNPLPPDSRVVEINWLAKYQCLQLTIQSEMLPEVPEGDPLPILPPPEIDVDSSLPAFHGGTAHRE